jgi:hypothetical protein
MSAITFLASSRPFEIQATNTVFGRIEVDADGWEEEVKNLFTLPYIYKILGADNSTFIVYIEAYMEVGDVVELWHIPNQHNFEYYRKRLMEHPEPIAINVGSLMYQDTYGAYQLSLEEISYKNFVTEHGITTIVKY